MAFELSEFLTQLMNMVPEADTELAAIIRNQLCKQAVMDYSRDRPDTVASDVTGDGGKYYPINTTNLASWSDEFSRISTIEYPAAVVASDETPVYLENDDYDQDYYAGGVRYLWLPNHAPASTETIRITYTAPYLWSVGTTTTAVVQASHGFSVNSYVYQNSAGTWVSAGTGTTANLLATHRVTAVADSGNFTAKILAVSVPEADFFAICNRAACLVCQAIAERFARTSDSSIAADSVNHTTRSELFRRQAKEFCDLYAEHLGLASAQADAERNQGLAEFVDLDTQPLWPTGREFLFHSRDTR